MIALLPICLSTANLEPRHVKRLTLGDVPLDLVCDVVEYFEHVEELNCVDIQSPQQVCFSNIATHSHKFVCIILIHCLKKECGDFFTYQWSHL